MCDLDPFPKSGHIYRRCEDYKMLLVKIKLLLMCDSKVLLTYLNLADVPTYRNVHVLYFHIYAKIYVLLTLLI